MRQIKELPRAKLLWFYWEPSTFYFAKNRLANAMRVKIGWLVVNFRMPWIPKVARTLHPECFE